MKSTGLGLPREEMSHKNHAENKLRNNKKVISISDCIGHAQGGTWKFGVTGGFSDIEQTKSLILPKCEFIIYLPVLTGYF